MPDDWPWRLRVGAAVGLWFCMVYGGADWLTAIRAGQGALPSPRSALDDWVPFWPYTAWIYMTVTPLLLLPLFVMRDRAALLALAWTLAAEIALAGAVYLAVPLAPTRMPHADLPAIMRLADLVNLTYNSLPSLHVALTVTCAAALTVPGRVVWNALMAGWAAAIALSAMLTHQHFVTDILAGLALAGLGIYGIMPRLQARASAVSR